MPDSLLPLLTERNRHDMVDFYRNHIEAKVRNRLNDYVCLDTLTDEYLHLTLSKAATAEMRLLWTADSSLIVSLIRTVSGPARDSQVAFYDRDWQRLHQPELPVPATHDYFAPLATAEGDTLRQVDFAQRSIDDLRLVEVTVSPDAPVFTFTVSTDLLAEEEKKVARRYVRPLRYRWTGRDFQPEVPIP